VAAVSLTIVKNGLSIYILEILGTHLDRSLITGRLHHQGGIVFFIWSLLVLSIVLWIVSRFETRTAKRHSGACGSSSGDNEVQDFPTAFHSHISHTYRSPMKGGQHGVERTAVRRNLFEL